MPDTNNYLISQITLPSGNTYQIKDAWARDQISALTGGSAVVFVGVSTTPLTDGGTERPTIEGSQVTATTGQIYFYGTQEFIYGNDSKWHALGSLDVLGDLAYVDTAQGSYTPSGSIHVGLINNQTTVGFEFTEKADNASASQYNYQPKGTVSIVTDTTNTKTATVSPVTIAANKPKTYTPAGTISGYKNLPISVQTAGTDTELRIPASKTVVTGVVAGSSVTAGVSEITYCSVDGTTETLTLGKIGYSSGDSVTIPAQGHGTRVKTGDAAYQINPSAADNILTFTGQDVRLETENIAVKGTFTGKKVEITGSTTSNVQVSSDAAQTYFDGTQATITVSPAGS